MLSRTQIEESLQQIYDVISSDAYSIEEKDGKLNRLSCLTGSASECQASAGLLYRQQISIVTRTLAKEKYAASHVKLIADGDCAETLALYEYSQRISSAIAHSIDALRTQISLHKTELEQSRYQQT